ncbi:MAG: HAD-IA family hydrolase [Acidobacteriota bacterium]
MGRVRVVALDLMDTLIHDPYREAIEAATGETLDRLRGQRDPSAWERFELGELDEAGYAAAYFLPTAKRTLDVETLRARMFAGYRFVEGMEALLAQLATIAPVHILSNYNRPWYREIRQRFELDRFVSGHHPSFELGARKPQPEYFQRALSRLGVAPDSVLFVDDRLVNVLAARESGLIATVFRDAATLRLELDWTA